jgi:hypothetical protein
MILVIGLSTFPCSPFGGAAAVAPENRTLRHQLMVLQRSMSRCRYVQHRERSSRNRQRPQALRGMQAAAVGSRGAGQRHVHCARYRA